MTDQPKAEQRPTTLTLHGIERTDPYAWLKAPSWQQVMRDPSLLPPDIREYLEAENSFLKDQLQSTEDLQKTLFEEYRGRIKEDDSSVPSADGEWAYYSRYETGGQHPIFCRRPRSTMDAPQPGGPDDRDEQILLHGDNMAQGLAYFRIGAADHSHDHRIMAYAVDTNGSEYFALRFKDLETGALLDDVIEHTSGNFAWAKDNRTVFYTVLDDNHRPLKVLRHVLGTPVADDVVVYEESDSGFFVGVGLTESRAFVTIETHDHVTSECWLIPADAPTTTPRVVAAREREVEYDVSHHRDRLIIRTNRDGAEDYKIVSAPLDDPAPARWTDIVAHESGRLILDVDLYAGHMVRLERVDALPRIVITDLSSGDTHTIAFEEEAYSLGNLGGYEFDTTSLRFAYSSMTTPNRVYDYDMVTRQRILRKEQEVPSGHDPSAYVSRRLMATSHDGETVPISILHRVDTPIDGTAPVLLYGYGSYGHALPASFGVTRLSLVDRGFVFALAHIRGGMEKGYRWYKAGKLEKKPNTFRDFIAAAEALRDAGYAHPDRIAAQGGSAGGMLMGAIANMRPDLFAAIVADVPFVDVLNTMCDDTLPLTPPEWPEWGNPIESEAAYRSIAAYSPYDNVSAQAYPAMLVTAGLTDPRVTYWEPAKWVARLRATKTDQHPLFLRTNMDAGHAGASGRFDALKEVALEQAFLLWVFDRA